MRILYVTNEFPYPLTSGLLRHYHFIRLLAADHTITLLSLTGGDHVAADRLGIEPFVAEIEAAQSSTRRRTPMPGALSRVRRLAGLGDAAANRLARSARARVDRGEHDVVVFSGRRTLPIFAALVGRLPIVADLCDATSDRLAGTRRGASIPRRVVLHFAVGATRRAELEIIKGATRTLFASERDRDLLLGAGPDEQGERAARAIVIPNGVDTDYWRRESRTLGRDEIVFTGRMDYLPNVDAAVQLVSEILPLVRREIPDARVTIVGADPRPRVQNLATVRGVEVTGRVPDMRPYLERAAVFACPLRFGAGIQNKVLEAMALEVPVVSTSVAADGLRIHGASAPITVAEDPRAFAAALSERLRDARNGASPDATERAYVSRHFTWQRAGELLAHTIAAAASPAEVRGPDSASTS